MHYNLENLTDVKPKPPILRQDEPYSLLFSTINHITLPRISIKEKVVIVGASNAGIAFIMGLISSQATKTYSVTFDNLTLITPHQFRKKDDELIDQLFIQKSHLTRNYLSMYSFDTYLNVIYGTMTEINRKEKRVKINGIDYVNYDYLILTCGEQYLAPNITVLDKAHRGGFELPKNVYVINTEVDAKYAINDVRRNTTKKGGGFQLFRLPRQRS